jgi:hypothetical protein
MINRTASMWNRKKSWILILGGIFLLTLVDHAYWATVAQWREDQATNLWMGFTHNLFAMPVGLISSANAMPNPNGMFVLGALFSRLPNLWVVSTLLGAFQAVLILWLCWELAGPAPLFLVISLPILASVVLCSTSVEFWNQWMLTSINLLFFGLWFTYLQKPTAWKIVLLILPMLITPAIYLAGLVNAILYFLITAVAVFIRPPRLNRTSWIAPVLIALLFIGLALRITWIPYAGAMVGNPLPGINLNYGSLETRFLSSLAAGLNFPIWNLMLWSQASTGTPFSQTSTQIISDLGTKLLHLSSQLLHLQSAVFLAALVCALVIWIRKQRPFESFYQDGKKLPGMVILSGVAFVILAYVLSLLLGGPNWSAGERMDQQVQFLPMLLLGWFSLPFVVNLPHWAGVSSRWLTLATAAAFTLISLVSGIQIIQSHLNYRGSYLSEGDVPLTQKMQVVDFIAHDWMKISNEKQIPVSYDLGGGRWNGVTNTGGIYEKWYPAPFTIGRAFDFELLRVYGLKNSQEGIQVRSMDHARYIVSYAFLDPPVLPGVNMTQLIFGRLRVSVVGP